MKKFFILGALLFVLAIPAHAASPYSEASDAAYKYYQAGQWLEAQEQAKEALALAITPSQKLYPLTLLAQSSVEDGQLGEAKQWLQQAQTQVPGTIESTKISADAKAKSVLLVAQLYQKLGDNEQALVLTQQALDIKDASSRWITAGQFNLGNILIKQGKFEAARVAFQTIIDLPDVDDGLYSLARFASAGSYANEKKNDEALRELGSVVDDPRVNLSTRAQSVTMRGNLFHVQGRYEDALNTYQDAFTLYEEAAKTEPEIRAREAAVFKGYMESYVKLNDNKGVVGEAMRLYAPVAAKVEVYNKAYNYQAALPYYQAMQGLNDYVPFEIMLATKTGLGVALMYGKDWDEARKLFDVAAKLKMSDGVQGQQRQNIAILQQNAQRLTAYSYLLQGQTQGGEIEFAKARELYDKLMATPDLNAATRVQAEKNIVELEKFEK